MLPNCEKTPSDLSFACKSNQSTACVTLTEINVMCNLVYTLPRSNTLEKCGHLFGDLELCKPAVTFWKLIQSSQQHATRTILLPCFWLKLTSINLNICVTTNHMSVEVAGGIVHDANLRNAS